MSDNNDLDRRLEAAGKALRERPRLADRVMEQVRTKPANQINHPFSDAESNGMNRGLRALGKIGRRWRWFGGITFAACTLLLSVLLMPSHSSGLDDVEKAVQTLKWLRASSTYDSGNQGTIWMSAERKVWAWSVKKGDRIKSARFIDGRQRSKYEFQSQAPKVTDLFHAPKITKLPLDETDLRRATLFDDIAQNRHILSPWLFGDEKIVAQKRREIEDAGKKWIEFDLTTHRGSHTQHTLRVDPRTNLPVFLVGKSPADPKDSFRWDFDYPANGPDDIYALGVPREVKIDDRMPSKECQQALDGIAASRASIGDFRMILYTEQKTVGIAPSLGFYVVQHKDSRWRVDLWHVDYSRHRGLDLPARKEGQSWNDWCEEQIKTCIEVPLFVCDGQTVFESKMAEKDRSSRVWRRSKRNGPGDLLSGEDSIGFGVGFAKEFFPNLAPRNGWGFEFDPFPADHPDCVLIKRSIHLASADKAVAHEWYYLDRNKGFAVARVEMFELLPGQQLTAESTKVRSTTVMKDFQQSPQGWWFAAEIDGSDPEGLESTEEKLKTHIHKEVRHYVFDFNIVMDDALFEVEETTE